MLDTPKKQRNLQHIYDDAADQWWSDDVRWVRTLKNMVPGRLDYFDQFIDWADKAVLDVGCAGGFMSEAIAGRGARVSGIDPAAGAIAAASGHAKKSGLDIDYRKGVGEALPHADETFDAVVCVDVLEHVSDLGQTLSEIARVLRPGGRFFFDTINRTKAARFATITIAEDWLGLLPQGTHDPALFIAPKTLTALLADRDLPVDELTGLGPRSIDLRGDFVFGRLPFKQVIYMGVATRA